MAIKINNPKYGNIFASADTFDELRSIRTIHITDGTNALVSGANSRTDGEGGMFIWNPTSATPDDGVSIISPDDGGKGRWHRAGRIARDGIDGAKGDTGGNVMSVGPRALSKTQVVPTGAEVIQTSGAASTSDGGKAQYVAATGQDVTFVANNPSWGFVDAAGKSWIMPEKQATPDMFRLPSDPAGDDTNAFERYRDGMQQLSLRFGALQHKLLLTRRYRITRPGALLQQGYTTKLAGLSIEGMTKTCGIDYDPATNGALMYNNDAVLGINLFRFSVQGFGNAANGAFWESVSSNGGCQDLNCIAVSIYGNWGPAIFDLGPTSTNNNSEFRWLQCSFSAFSGHPTCVLRSRGSDQHLNYWFSQCNNSGDVTICDMQKGGHVSIRDHDSSGFRPTTPRYLVSVGDGSTHAGGVCQLIIDSLRTEQAPTTDDPTNRTSLGRLLHSTWPGGIIRITNCDASSQGFRLDSVPDNILIEYNGGESGPTVMLDNNILLGNMRIVSQGVQVEQRAQILLHGNTFLHATTPDQYVTFDATTLGARPEVVFSDENRGRQPSPTGALVAWGANVGACTSPSGMAGKVRLNGSRSARKMHTFAIRGYNGGLPAAGEALVTILPLGAILKDLNLFLPAGTTGNGYDVGVKVVDGAGTVLVDGYQTGKKYSDGFNITIPMNVHLDTDTRRRLTLTVIGSTSPSDTECWGTYLA
jgi:hypothetical protein